MKLEKLAEEKTAAAAEGSATGKGTQEEWDAKSLDIWEELTCPSDFFARADHDSFLGINISAANGRWFVIGGGLWLVVDVL